MSSAFGWKRKAWPLHKIAKASWQEVCRPTAMLSSNGSPY